MNMLFEPPTLYVKVKLPMKYRRSKLAEIFVKKEGS